MNERTAQWSAIAVSVAAIGIAGYFAVAGLVDPSGVIPGGGAYAARIFAGYVAVRSFVLLGAVAISAITRRWAHLQAALILNSVVQAGDVVVGLIQRDVVKSVGPAVLGVLLLLAATWLSTSKEAA